MLKYIAATFAGILMWFFVALICSLTALLFFSADGRMPSLLTFAHPASWLGTILGLAAGIHSARATYRAVAKLHGGNR